MKKLFTIATTATLSFLLFNSCKTIPKGATPVKSFNINKYLGKWYEIARLDHVFEENMDNNTATYSLREDGKINVLNKGYDYKEGEWSSVEGKAKFADSENEGKLKVSFFGPFYSGYNIIELDEDYKYALVAGKSLDYLWILSREKTIPQEVKLEFLRKAKEIGFDTSELIWVDQNKSE